MTLGEDIWAESISRVAWYKLDQPTLQALGRLVIKAIDKSFADLKRSHEPEKETRP